jgi:hypothetical protein
MKTVLTVIMVVVSLLAGLGGGYLLGSNQNHVETNLPYAHSVTVSGSITLQSGGQPSKVEFISVDYTDDHISSTVQVSNDGGYSILLPNGYNFDVSVNYRSCPQQLYLGTQSSSFTYDITC